MIDNFFSKFRVEITMGMIVLLLVVEVEEVVVWVLLGVSLGAVVDLEVAVVLVVHPEDHIKKIIRYKYMFTNINGCLTNI